MKNVILIATCLLYVALTLDAVAQDKDTPNTVGIGDAASKPATAPTSVPTTSTQEAPTVKFFGMDGRAAHVVYVIDRSGSMLDTFDALRNGLRESINGLKGTQDFHLIFFSAGAPFEMPGKKLTPASEHSKKAAGELLHRIVAEGQTDPLPAIKRAIDVLNKAEGGMHNKVVVLVTDGAFPDNNKVFMLIKKLDPKNEIRFFTVLFDTKEPDAEKALKKIADDSGGQYKQVHSEAEAGK